jgi:4-hydroxybenzoate polyprenyltransferase
MIGPLVQELRPKQWTKNLLLFAGVIFSQHLTQPAMLLRAGAGFLAFSLLSGSVYLLNDLKDIEEDRRHPVKRLRPLAAGRLSRAAAWAALIPLLAIVATISAWLGRPFTMVVLLYLAFNLAYNLGLKQLVLVDVFFVAIGFVLRAIAGVQLMLPVAPHTELSPWMLVCTFFGALFLALAKRRREIVNAGDGASLQRAVLRHYSTELLDALLTVSAAASLMSYALYTIWPETVAKFQTKALIYTVPFVAYGIFRYFYLVRATETTEDPSQVLLTDRPLAGCVALYLVTVVVILYLP